MKTLRIEKINEQIKKIIAQIISVKYSEEFPFITINFVYTSKDLSYSKIYINLFSQDQEKNFSKFIKKTKEIQSIFAKKIFLKKTPKIEFILDKHQKKINKLESLLDKIKTNEN